MKNRNDMKRDWVIFVMYVVGASLAIPVVAEDPGVTRPDMSLCITCHGAEGEGNRLLNAPSLTNLEAWYVDRQLRNFRDGLRGADPSDEEGVLMRPMVQFLSDESIRDYALTVSEYPDRIPDAVDAGDSSADASADASKGKAYYSHQCGACHGPGGKGIKSIGAPGLAGLDSWYLKKQLDKFQSGIRGSAKGDTHGGQMVYYMNRLKNKEDLDDIIAYLRDPGSVD